MIKPTELRIGNSIYYKSGRIQVTMIGEYGIQSKTKTTCINAKFDTTDLSPIPLTEEWLLRFSFEEVKGIGYKKDVLSFGKIVLYFNEDGDYKFCELVQQRGYALGHPEVEHVHQLQNLYHALTGEELEFKQQ